MRDLPWKNLSVQQKEVRIIFRKCHSNCFSKIRNHWAYYFWSFLISFLLVVCNLHIECDLWTILDTVLHSSKGKLRFHVKSRSSLKVRYINRPPQEFGTDWGIHVCFINSPICKKKKQASQKHQQRWNYVLLVDYWFTSSFC